MAREMTEAEQAAMRSDGQASKVYAAILKPETVFSCRVNQSFASSDKVAGFNFDGGSGDYTDVLPGMLVLVGSTAGARNLGVSRVRKAWTSSAAYIGETSEIAWENDLYITVLDDFRLHPKHIFTLDDRSIKVDYDVAYSNQHSSFAPVVVMGPHAVAWLVGGEAEIAFDASASWCLSSGAKSYAWAASAGTFDNASSATPTLTVDTWSNHILVSCTVTVNGVASTGQRYVFLFDDDHPPYGVQVEDEPQGDYEDGGWQFAVSQRDDLSDIQPNPLVVLFARDWYGGLEVSYGPLAGRENVIVWGWAENESLVDDTHGGAVTLNVKGPHWWLQRMNYPVGIDLVDTTSSPASWQEHQGLTVDKAVFDLLHWRSTATLCIDVILSGDTRQAPGLVAQADSAWAQLEDLAWKRIWAKPCCDRYGRLYVEIDAQMLSASDRASIPVVTTIEKTDWRGELEITRRTVGGLAQVDLSTLAHASGVTTALYSLAPGHILAQHGTARIADNYLAADQDESNEMAGLMLARENIPYEFRIQAAANQRLIDLCPRQYIGLSIAASDTPRGIAYNGNAIVREVSLTLEESGFLSASWEAEAASEIVAGIDGDVPLEDGSSQSFGSSTPNFGSLEIPNLPIDLGGWDGEADYDNAPSRAVILMSHPSPTLCWTFDFNSLRETGPIWGSMNFGLTLADLPTLGYLDINRGGRCYLANRYKLWSAYIGEQWQLVHDFTADDLYIRGMGCNPLAADSVALIAGKQYPGEYAHIWVGSSGGISQQDEMLYPPGFDFGELSYGGGKWLFSHTQGVLGSGRLTRFSASGSEEASYTTVEAAINHYHARAANADRILHYLAKTIYTDGGATETEIGSPYTAASAQSAALTPDGVRVLGLADDGRIRKSSDGGLTWSTLPDTVIGIYSYYAAIACIDPNRWAFTHGAFGATLPRVFYSPDFGANWTEKTGNLRSLAGVDFRPFRIKLI